MSIRGIPKDSRDWFDFAIQLAPERSSQEKDAQRSGQKTIMYIEKEILDELRLALSKRDFFRIIKNFELFWLAFCYAFYQSSPPHPAFQVSLEGSRLKITGTDTVISLLQGIIEDAGQVFAEGLARKEHFTIKVLGDRQEKFLRDAHRSFPSYDLSDEQRCCRDIVVQSFGCLAKLVGAVSSLPRSNIEVLNYYDSVVEQEICLCDIYWVDPIHQILPEEPLERSSVEYLLYPLYEVQKFSDWTLAGSEGKLKVDSTILFVRGGLAIQRIMKRCLEEEQEKVLSLEGASASTVKAFAEYLYAGEISPQFASKHRVLLDELLQIAYRYDCQALIDSCTNLISTFASYAVVDQIKALAAQYKNDHLKKLCQIISERYATVETSPISLKDCWMDISCIFEMLDQERVSPILLNKDLFWLLFCKEFSRSPKFLKSDRFDVICKGRALLINGKESDIEFLRKLIEEFRVLLAKAYLEERNCIICFLSYAQGLAVFREKASEIDLSSELKERNSPSYDSSHLCHRFIFPVLNKLCDRVGAQCFFAQGFQMVVYSTEGQKSFKSTNEFIIQWLDISYPIELIKIPPRPPFGELLYELYERRELVDFTLSVENEIFRKVHASILLAYGGKMRKMMLESSLEKTLALSGISSETLDTFIKYLYLGPNGLSLEKISKDSLGELYCLAKTYQILHLIDCCVNFICLNSSFDDIERIQKLIERHYSAPLDRLQKYLTSSPFLELGEAQDSPNYGESASRPLGGFPDDTEFVSPYALFLHKV